MADNKIPVGCTLKGVSADQYEGFDGDALCLEQVRFFFEDTDISIVLQPIPETDEIQLTYETVPKPITLNTPSWCASFVGQKLQTVWQCENSQGYLDQIILAFDLLHPSLAFVSEGSVLKVFHCEELKK